MQASSAKVAARIRRSIMSFSAKHDPARRSLLLSAGSMALVAAAGLLPKRAFAGAMPATVAIENFSPAGKSLGVAHVAKVLKSEADWKKQLSAEQFDVTRHAGTEEPYTGATWNNHADGLYRCICCDTALYDSRTKFESGTGWPSFWQPISRINVVQTSDSSLFMTRTAISCARCDAHLGHVFDDGPKPTGLRYCMNSAAMKFVARASV
jgi:peptide-methionine (R)-S-oxide reductase